MTDTPDTKPGIGVDSAGNPTVDPSKNVLNLVEAETKRQDDLRQAEKEHNREVLALRSELGQQDSVCAGEIATLRADHAKDLREAEAARIDAIREVDVKAVQQAAQVQATQASALAAQVATTAEAMRTQVGAAATAAQVALAAALEPIIKDIADLRRAQYEAQGVRAQGGESRAGFSSATAVAAVVVSALAVIVVIIIALSSGGTP